VDFGQPQLELLPEDQDFEEASTFHPFSDQCRTFLLRRLFFQIFSLPIKFMRVLRHDNGQIR
jgi:hypothetical protein